MASCSRTRSGLEIFAGREKNCPAASHWSIEALRRGGSQDNVRLAEALERLVQLDEARGKPDEAAKWRKELEAQTAYDAK
jgi:hypothetical protein